jgi:hypothetical protein
MARQDLDGQARYELEAELELHKGNLRTARDHESIVQECSRHMDRIREIRHDFDRRAETERRRGKAPEET